MMMRRPSSTTPRGSFSSTPMTSNRSGRDSYRDHNVAVAARRVSSPSITGQYSNRFAHQQTRTPLAVQQRPIAQTAQRSRSIPMIPVHQQQQQQQQQQFQHHPNQQHQQQENGGGGGALRADEVRRIVDKCQSHFSQVIDSLRADNESLRVELDMQQPPPPTSSSSNNNNNHSNNSSPRSLQVIEQQQQLIEQLRNDLAREKRARLESEELASKMSDQNSKLVATLEKRLSIYEQKQQQGGGFLVTTPRSSSAKRPGSSSSAKKEDRLASSYSSPPQHLFASAVASSSSYSNPATTNNNTSSSSSSSVAASNGGDVSTSFFDQVSKQLEDINSREESRSALLRKLL